MDKPIYFIFNLPTWLFLVFALVFVCAAILGVLSFLNALVRSPHKPAHTQEEIDKVILTAKHRMDEASRSFIQSSPYAAAAEATGTGREPYEQYR